jgi:protein TonB
MVLRIILVCKLIYNSLANPPSETMFIVAPRMSQGPRALPLAAVAAIHVVVVAGLILMPAVQERLWTPPPMFVDYREAPREQPPEPKPLPKPALRDPLTVTIPMPPIALAPEVQITPPTERAPAISAPVFTPTAPSAPAAAPAAVEAPRFDLAYLKNPPPAYPNLSRRMKEQGRVILRVLVSASGEPQDVEVRSSSGFERLDRAAMDAVRRWRFAPARHGAESIAAWALVPVLFQLET